MNKSLLLALTVLSVKTFATPIPQDKLASYKAAVKLAVSQRPLSCQLWPSNTWTWGAGTVEDSLETMTAGEISSNGSQPLLIFSYKRNGDFSETYIKYKVTTSNDFKSVFEITAEQSSCALKEINLGDLQNPNIVQQRTCSVTHTAVCQ